MMTPHSQLLLPRWRAAAEVILPVVAISAWTWIEPMGHSHRLDVLFGIFLGVIIITIAWREGLPSAQEAGLSPHTPHARAIVRSLLAVLPLLVAVVAWAWATGRLYADAALLRALIFYPFGAFVQEAVVFVFVLPRAEAAWGQRTGLAATALLFGALHLPNPLLSPGSVLLVLALSWGWRRERSLIALALAHGLLGAVCDKAIHVSMRIGISWFG
jgi:membrane protease YdiL (CAAX protease family)